MSVYGNAIKTHVIDPVYHRNNFRSEFRIESNAIYYPNLRLINLGVSSTAGTEEYLNGVGAYGIIKNISIQDNNQVLSQITDVGKWMNFTNYNKANSSNMDMRSNLGKSNVANVYEGKDAGATMVGAKVDAFSVRNSALGNTGTNAKNNSRGWLDLKEVLPVLKNMQSVNTNLFSNLKIVVEYQVDPNEYLKNTNAGAPTTYEPSLIIDEVIGENEKNALSSIAPINYTDIEQDRAVVAPVVCSTTDDTVKTFNQRTTFHLSGFNNKTVGRMVIMKNPLDSDTTSYKKDANESNRYGKNQSMSFLGEKFNLRVDGQTVLAGEGIDRAEQRMAMLTDTWGLCSSYPFSSSLCNAQGATDRKLRVLNGESDYSVLDYYGLFLNRPIGDLQMDFTRQGYYAKLTGQNQAERNASSALVNNNRGFNLNVYAEVYKSIVPNGKGGYSINYV